MDRRTFLAGAVFSLSSLVASQVAAIQHQRQIDRQQDQTTTSLLADQKSLAREQTELNKTLDDLSDLAPLNAMQSILVRVLCDMLAVPEFPSEKVYELLMTAQRYVLSGGDPRSKKFWEGVIEFYIEENSGDEAEGSAFLMRLTAL